MVINPIFKFPRLLNGMMLFIELKNMVTKF